MSIALSRMNKKQLYEECKNLRRENMKLTLFQDQDIMNENAQLKFSLKKGLKVNDKLINDIACLEDIINKLRHMNRELTRDYKDCESLFEDDEDEIKELKLKIKELINDVACLEDIIKNLKEKE